MKDNHKTKTELIEELTTLRQRVAELEAEHQPSQKYRALEEISENIPETVMLTDVQGDIFYVNPAFEQITGYRADEIIGQKPSILKSGHQDQAVYQKLWVTISAGKTWQAHFLNKRKDGTLYHVDKIITPIFNEAGEIIGYAGIGKDTTDKILINHNLQGQTRLLKTIINNFPDSYMGVINADMTIGYTAGSEFGKQGIDPNQFVGMSVADVFSVYGETVVTTVIDHYQKTFAKQKQTFELYITNQYQQYNVIPLIEDDGQVRQILSVVRNITQQKEEEAKLTQQNERLTQQEAKLTQQNEMLTQQEEMLRQIQDNLQESNLRYTNLYEYAPVAYIICDERGTILKANRTAHQLFRDDDKAIAELFFSYVMWDDRDILTLYLRKIFETESRQNCDLRLLTSSGAQLYSRLTGMVNKGKIKKQCLIMVTDITELDKYRSEIERVAQDLTQLIDTANAPIFGIDAQGLVNEWNQTAQRITDFTKDDVMGKSMVDEFITEDYREAVKQVLDNALQGEQTANYEFPLYTKAGQRVMVLLNASTRRSAQGEIIGVIGVGQDITELDSYRSEMERVAQDLTQLIDTANAPIFGIDAQGLVNEWNQTAQRITGFTKDDVMGHDLVQEFITKEYREAVKLVLDNALQGEQTANYEFPLYTKVGQRVMVLLNASTRRSAQGEIIGVIGVGQDITELDSYRSRIEQAVQDLTRLIDSANAPIFGIDLQGNINEWNKTAERITCFSKEDVMGYSLVDELIIDEYKKPVKKVLDDALRGKETANYEFSLYTKAGERVMILLNASTRRTVLGNIIGVIGVGQDITELTEYRHKIEVVVQDLIQLIDGANAPIFGIDIQGKVNEWNKTAQRITGFTKQDVMGHDLVQEFITEEYREAVKLVLDNALHGRETANYEFPLYTKAGERVMVLLNASTRRSAHGEIIGVIGVGQDITELDSYRSEMEKLVLERTAELEEVRRNFQSVVDKNQVGIMVVDHSGMVQFANPAMQQLLSMHGALVGHKFGIPITAGQQLAVRVMRANGELGNAEMTVVETTWQYSASYLVMLHDVTERHQAEETLRDTLAFNENIITSSPMGIAIYQADGQCILTNETVGGLIGASKAQVLSQNFRQIKSWQKAGLVDDAETCLSSGEEKWRDIHVISSFDKEVWLESRFSRFSSGGKYNLLLILNDIGERKRAEILLRQERASLAEQVETRTAELRATNAELQRANRLKDEFLANMSHELRTPLNSVLGMSEILTDEVYGPLNEKQQSSVQAISTSGSHLLALITDILDLSKIESGKFELEIETVSVSALCQSSIQFVKQLAIKKQIKIYTPQIDDSLYLQVDQRRLKQILINLLSNAVKFTPVKGRVGLQIELDQEHNILHLEVWDAGIGIAEEDMARLFDPFVQLDAGLNRQQEGTGLGLALVYRLTEMHGGTVSVTSTPNHGSQFTISLPWQAKQGSPPSIPPKGKEADSPSLWEGANAGTDRPLVLVAEDNPSNIAPLKGYLEAKGYKVVIAYDGHEAVDLAMEKKPALILMDIQMPNMDGLEATRHIRANADTAHIPIIAVTALAMPGDEERCLEAGANAYMSKPVKMKLLMEMIGKAVENYEL
ncbi:PAS domain S-box protein [Anaerolineales bacterium HSG6]|nr:PAS domain S-box protein [Anaerolineales bacterium HSG6]